MVHAKNAGDQFCGQRRRVLDFLFRERVEVRQIVVEVFYPVFPFLERRLAAVALDDKLLLAVTHHSWHPRIAGGIAVLLVNRQSVVRADLIQEVHALAVFFDRRRVHAHDCVGGLAAGMNDADARQLKLLVDRNLLVNGLGVGFNERIAEVRHVLVLAPLAVNRVYHDPCAALLVWCAYGFFKAGLRVLLERLEDFGDGLVVCALRGDVVAVALKRVCAIGHMLVRLEKGGEVFAELGARVPLVRLAHYLGFKPVRIDDTVVLRAHLFIPADGVGLRVGARCNVRMRKRLLLSERNGLVPFAGAQGLVA